MIVASTIVPLATFTPLAVKCRCTSSNNCKQLPAQIVLFEQMAEAAYRGLVGHRLAAEVDPDKPPHRRRIVKRLLHRRVRQVEPLLQKIDAPHPLDPDRRAAIAWFGINRFEQPAQRPHATTRSISATNTARRVGLR